MSRGPSNLFLFYGPLLVLAAPIILAYVIVKGIADIFGNRPDLSPWVGNEAFYKGELYKIIGAKGLKI